MLDHDEFDDTGIFNDIDVELNHFQEIYPNLSNSESSNYYNLETFNKLPGKNKNDLSIFYQNIRSLNSNYDNVSDLLSSLECKFDILCFTESWLTSHSAKFYEFNDYSSFHILREAKTFLSYGGVSAYISRELIASKIDNYNPYIESLFLNVSKNKEEFVLGLVYRPPNTDCNIFIEKLEEIREFSHSACLLFMRVF